MENLDSGDKQKIALKTHIQDTERKIFGTTLDDYKSVQDKLLPFIKEGKEDGMTKFLSRLYLYYALRCTGEESLVYMHRAVALNPKIELTSPTSNPESLPWEDEQEKTPGYVRILEAYIGDIKKETQEKGIQPLDFHEIRYKMIKSGEIPDPHIYSSTLDELTDEEFQREKRRVAKQEMGVGSFLSEMLLSSQQDKRDRERWKKGTQLPKVSFEQLETIFSSKYPRHVIIDPEAIGGISLQPSRRYDNIDQACDMICLEISKRLSRRLDAYRFRQGTAKEEIEIEGLGKMKITISGGEGAFTYISEIKSDKFRIWNCRGTGRKYLDRRNDIALPTDIEINDDGLQTKLTLYEDDSGIFLERYGLKYTNKRVEAFGQGLTSDGKRDDLYPSRQDLEKTENPELREFLIRKGVMKKSFIPDEMIFDSSEFEKYTKNPAGYKKFFAEMELPSQLSYRKESRTISDWLVRKVLKRIVLTPERRDQAKTQPAPIPYPEKIGPLYTWIPLGDAEKIEIIGKDSDKAYPDERNAIDPRWRLIPWDIPGKFPEETQEGFIWCGVGPAAENAPSDLYDIPGHHMDSGSLFDYRNQLVQITPKHGEEVYVVDYQAWDDYRETAFKTTETLSSKQLSELYSALANTFVPINEYKGNYKKPTVVISRALGLDEVELVKGTIYDPRKEEE